MKISELIPSKLPGIALRTLQGLMTGEDHDYLKEHCDIDVLESWFCDDNSLELDIKSEDGTLTTVDLGDIEGLVSDLDNYQEIVYYSLLAHAAAQLPDWVYESTDFSFDWGSRPNLTLQEFDTAYEKVWDMVFNGENPGWRNTLPNCWSPGWTASWRTGMNCWGMNGMTSLEADILRTMFGYCPPSNKYHGNASNSLPTWLIDGNFPVSRNFLENLREVNYLFEPEVEATPKDVDSYVSPFTGKPV